MIYNDPKIWRKKFVDTWGDILIDFYYTFNPRNGTATITGWKGTLNGEPSTVMVVPDYDKIIF